MTKTPSKKIIERAKQPFFSLTSDAKIKISLWALISKPLSLIFSNWQNLFILGVPAALLLTISSYLAKHSIICGLETDFSLSSAFCSDSIILYYTDMLIRLMIIFFFSIKWYHFSLQKEPLKLKELIHFGKSEAKTFGIMFFFIIINISPIIGLFMLMIRVPNPDWRIELAYFTSIAWVFLLPIISIRFYPIISFAIEGCKLPSIKQIWNQTAGNMLKFLLSISVFCFLTLLLFSKYYVFINNTPITTFISALSADFEYNILIILFVVYFTNYCYIQRNLLYKGDNNDK